MKSRTISLKGVRSAAMLGFGALFLAACADESKPLNTFNPEGPRAEAIDNLMKPIWWLAGIIGVLVVGGGIVLAIRNRVKPEDFDYDDLPEQVHGNPTLEWAWTAAPALLLAGISWLTVVAIWDLEERNDPGGGVEACGGEGELDVMVIGQQWWWEYRYDVDCDGFFEDVNPDSGLQNSTDVWDDADAEWPLEIALDDDDVSVANEMVIPVGQQIDLTITSRDVIHSFWVPRLNGKKDAVPGRLHFWNFEASEAGEFTGWCTEYCGLSHARMRMNTIALPQDEFDEWLANQSNIADIPAEGTEAAAGRETFQQQCASCHIVWEEGIGQDALYTGARNEGDDSRQGRDFVATELAAKAAPNLTHFASRTVMAGAIYSTYVGLDANDNDLSDPDKRAILDAYNELADEIDESDDTRDSLRWNRAQLKRWIKNAPSQKDMDPDDMRGMPAFPGLADEDIDNIIAYLATLD